MVDKKKYAQAVHDACVEYWLTRKPNSNQNAKTAEAFNKIVREKRLLAAKMAQKYKVNEKLIMDILQEDLRYYGQ